MPVATTTRRRLLTAIAVTAIAVLLAGTWRFGGFHERQSPFEQIPPGTTIDAGPFELTFTEATAVHLLKNDYREASWKITVIGTGRTTGDETISPRVGFGTAMFLTRNLSTAEVRDASGQDVGDGTGRDFTPGLPPVRYALTFAFADNFRVDPTLRFAVVDQEYGSRALIQTDEDDDEEWHNAQRGWRMDLPLTELPAQDD